MWVELRETPVELLGTPLGADIGRKERRMTEWKEEARELKDKKNGRYWEQKLNVSSRMKARARADSHTDVQTSTQADRQTETVSQDR